MCVELTELRPIYLAYSIQTNEKNLNIEIEVHRIWYWNAKNRSRI